MIDNHRIADHQSVPAKAKQVLMTAHQMGILTYREPYQLNDEHQRNSLTTTLGSEFGATFTLPDPARNYKGDLIPAVVYLIVLENEPILLPETEVVPFVLGVVLATAGVQAARQVSYRGEMLPVDGHKP